MEAAKKKKIPYPETELNNIYLLAFAFLRVCYQVVPDSDAHRAGLQEGDQVLSVNEVDFQDIEHSRVSRTFLLGGRNTWKGCFCYQEEMIPRCCTKNPDIILTVLKIVPHPRSSRL